MCTGMEIAAVASLASTLGGTYLQMRAQNDAKKDMNSAIATNNAQNQELRNSTYNQVMDAASGYDKTNMQDTQATNTEDLRSKLIASLSGGDLPADYYQGKRSSNTEKYVKEMSDKATDYSTNRANAMADLKGFDQTMRGLNETTTKAAENESMNKSFESGNNSVLNTRLQQIQNNSGSMMGDLLTTAGSIGQAITLPATASKFFGFGTPTDITAKTVGSSALNGIKGKAIDLSKGFFLA